eukprot:6776371-Alexandrium_andersonii.AAC.1
MATQTNQEGLKGGSIWGARKAQWVMRMDPLCNLREAHQKLIGHPTRDQPICRRTSVETQKKPNPDSIKCRTGQLKLNSDATTASFELT